MASTSLLADDVSRCRISSNHRCEAIRDQFATMDELRAAWDSVGLDSVNMILAVDFTASNTGAGRRSFSGRSLHHLGEYPGDDLNPYEQVISIIGNAFGGDDDYYDDDDEDDEDAGIPVYGFGDATCEDTLVFSFNPGNVPCRNLDAVLHRYRQLAPHVRLAGPTSFAPIIRQACEIVNDSCGEFHVLIIIADGQVTRGSDVPPGQLSEQEQATVEALVEASELPLSVVVVGVGDGPWGLMREFDDALPRRRFDNFQFVNFTDIMCDHGADPSTGLREFVRQALQEVPSQYQIAKEERLLGRTVRLQQCLPPLDPPEIQTAAAAAAAEAAAEPATGPLANPLFECPITRDVMRDPVVAADGFTYERRAIEAWLVSHDTSPLTNAELEHKQLTPNNMLRSAIMEARQSASA